MRLALDSPGSGRRPGSRAGGSRQAGVRYLLVARCMQPPRMPSAFPPLQLTCGKGASMCDAWRLTTEPRPLASSSGGSKCAAEGRPCALDANCCPLPNFYATASEPARCQCAAAAAGQSPQQQQLQCVRRARCSAAGERCGSGAAWSHSNCCAYSSEPRGLYCQPATANGSSGTAASPQAAFVCKDDCFPPTAQGEVAVLLGSGPWPVTAATHAAVYNGLVWLLQAHCCHAAPALQWLSRGVG